VSGVTIGTFAGPGGWAVASRRLGITEVVLSMASDIATVAATEAA